MSDNAAPAPIKNLDYAVWVAGRVVRLFKYLVDFVDPASEEFIAFVKDRVRSQLGEDLSSLPYSTVYETLRKIVFEYAQTREKLSPKRKTRFVMRRTEPVSARLSIGTYE